MENFLVSIVIATYNHSNYINKCIDNILSQEKKGFDIEIVIADDCSTDNTQEILENYKKKHPDIFKLILRKKNIGVPINSLGAWYLSSGKYMAIIDGDDYWNDNQKLINQIAILEEKPNCNYVFSNYTILRENDNKIISSKFPKEIPKYLDLHKLLNLNIMPASLTVVLRRSVLPKKLPDFCNKAFNFDWCFLFLFANDGLIGYLNSQTGIYRQGVGIVSKTKNSYKFINGLKTNMNLNKLTNYRFDYHIGKYEWHLQNIVYSLIEERNLVRALFFLGKKIIISIKENSFNQFISKNLLFLKHSIKLIFKK